MKQFFLFSDTVRISIGRMMAQATKWQFLLGLNNKKNRQMKMKNLWTVAVAFLLAAFIGGCKDDNVEKIGLCPIVVSTNPAPSATEVALDQTITITFNEAMNPATITPAAFTLLNTGLPSGRMAAATEVQGSLKYDAASFTMSFTPDDKLLPEALYSGTVSSVVKDLTGNALQVDYTWTFSTGSTLSPNVIATDPEDLAAGVFLNKRIEATFNAPMNPSSITTATFILKQGETAITGTVSYADSTAAFIPSSDLASNTTYTATITTGAKDVPGNFLTKDFSWSFTTGTITAPNVTSTDPEPLATDVSLNKVISAIFSEPMNAASVITSFTLSLGTTDVMGTVNYAGTTATFTPLENLLSGSTYTATIKASAQNASQTPLANEHVWTFTTAAPLGPQGVDLNSVARFGIIAGVGVSNNAGFSEIRNMDVGISPGVRSSITGFPPAIIVNGAIYASDDIAPPGIADMLSNAKQDLTDAYLFAEGATAPAPVTVAGDQGGTTLPPGIYKSVSTLLIQSGNLTLDGKGDVNAVWIFQIASDFTTVGGAGGDVLLINGAQAKNVYWQTGSSATIGDGTSFKGNILALTSITMNSGAVADGRMLARNGSVVLTNTNIINKP